MKWAKSEEFSICNGHFYPGSHVSPAFLRRSTTDSVNVQLGLGDIMAGVGTKNATNRGPKAEMRETYARLHFSTVPYYSVLFRTACSCMWHVSFLSYSINCRVRNFDASSESDIERKLFPPRRFGEVARARD